MEYKIVNREGFRVVGYALRVPMSDSGHSVSIPKFWDEVMEDGRFSRLMAIADEPVSLGMCANFDADMSSFDYVVGVFSRQGALPEGAIEVPVTPQRWAVFETHGKMPQAIQDLNIRVFQEWFPSSGLEHAEAPDFELYPEGENTDDYRTELWVPVK
jgi:AraC family transcriptional regulator